MGGAVTLPLGRQGVKTRLAIVVVMVVFVVSAICAPGEGRGQASTLPGFASAFTEDVGARETDLVIIIDRSSLMGKNWFYVYEKKLVRQLITRYVLLYPDYVRMSLITFAREATIDTDGIRAGSRGLNKCHLFYGTDAPWHDVYFKSDPVQAKGKNITDALIKARIVLQRGQAKRPGTKQVILLLTDGAYNVQTDGDPIETATTLKISGIRIYAVGTGDWLRIGNVRELASGAQFYGSYSQWTSLTQRSQRGHGKDVVPIWTRIDQSKCSSLCEGDSRCFCDIISGYSSCMCRPGYQQDRVTGTCSPCQYHEYKDTPGSLDSCTLCPPAQGTRRRGATKADCTCGQEESDCHIFDPCLQNPCREWERCINTDRGWGCICAPGFERDPATGTCFNPLNCPAENPCINGDCVDSAGNYTCLCIDAYMGRHCEINIDECRYQPCENSAVCVDGVNSYECQCLAGFKGRDCEEIVPITEKPSTTTTTTTSTTTSTTTTTTTTKPTTATPTTTTTTTARPTRPKPTPGTTPTPRPSPSTPSKPTTRKIPTILPEQVRSTAGRPRTSTTPAKPTPSDTTQNSTATLPAITVTKNPRKTKETTTISVNAVSAAGLNMNTIIIIAAAGGGGLLLLILLIIIIVCCCVRRGGAARKQRRKRRHTDSPKVAAGGATTHTNRYAKQSTKKPIVKSISQRFSGLWKSKTMRGGVWEDDDNTFTGAPSVPSRARPDLLASSLSDPKSTTVDEILVSNEAIVQGGGMAGWVSYLNDLQKTEVIQSGAIAHVDGEKNAVSSEHELEPEEVDMAHDILVDKLTDVTLLAQDSEFVIDTNNGNIAVGRTLPDDVIQEIIVLSHTKKFVIMLIASEDISTDITALKREAQWIADHISGEGY